MAAPPKRTTSRHYINEYATEAADDDTKVAMSSNYPLVSVGVDLTVQQDVVFSTCIVRSLALQRNQRVVMTSTQTSDGILRLCLTPSISGLPLEHSPRCPLQQLGEELESGARQYSVPAAKRLKVRVRRVAYGADTFDCVQNQLAVCVLAVDNEGKVLLTRRAKHMRIFPSAWCVTYTMWFRP